MAVVRSAPRIAGQPTRRTPLLPDQDLLFWGKPDARTKAIRALPVLLRSIWCDRDWGFPCRH